MSCLYVIELGNGRIKVGQSVDPQKRLATHRAAARAHGLTPGREWSGRYGRGAHETDLIRFCYRRASEGQGEYFAGVPFDVAVAYAKHLPNKTAALEAVAKVESATAVVARFTPATPAAESLRSSPPIDLGGRVAELRGRLAEHAAAMRVNGLGRVAVSVTEAAEWLDIPESILKDAIGSGELPIMRLGRRIVRIPVESLDEFFARLDPDEEAAS